MILEEPLGHRDDGRHQAIPGKLARFDRGRE
jgi:hypothetical protein